MVLPPHGQVEQLEDQQHLLLSGSQVCHSLELHCLLGPQLFMIHHVFPCCRALGRVVIVLPLESGGNNLHVLLVAERELQRDLTLQLFANSILSDSAVVMMGLAAFRQHATAYVDMTRAQVQVSLT